MGKHSLAADTLDLELRVVATLANTVDPSMSRRSGHFLLHSLLFCQLLVN